jgi:hypothetical protein
MAHLLHPSRRLLFGAAGVLIVLLVVACPSESLPAPPLHDFVEYWAAGRLLLSGENPYDPERMHDLERQAGREDDGILMWNPPWALPLVAPLGLLDVRTAHRLWLLVNLAVILFCANALWRLYDGSPGRRWLAVLLAAGFLPSWFALIAGQISPLLLLGAAAFLMLLKQNRPYAAGAATVLLAIKPHLTWLFWLALLAWAMRERRWRLLVGGATAGLILTGAALALDPGVVGQYWHTFTHRPPEQYRSPTLGALIRLALGEGGFRWQFLPMLPGLAWLLWYGSRRREWDWSKEMPLLLLAGVLTTAYGGWPFDLVLLLLPVVAVAAELSRGGSPVRCATAMTVYVAINWLALVLLSRGVEYLWFIWMTPALLLGYLIDRGLRARYFPCRGWLGVGNALRGVPVAPRNATEGVPYKVLRHPLQ